MDILSTILKTVDFEIEADDILDVIAKRSPGLAFFIAAVIGLGGVICVVLFFMSYMNQ